MVEVAFFVTGIETLQVQGVIPIIEKTLKKKIRKLLPNI
jgi:hypothetical protein